MISVSRKENKCCTMGGRLEVFENIVSMSWSTKGWRVPLLTRRRARVLVLVLDEKLEPEGDGEGVPELEEPVELMRETVVTAESWLLTVRSFSYFFDFLLFLFLPLSDCRLLVAVESELLLLLVVVVVVKAGGRGLSK